MVIVRFVLVMADDKCVRCNAMHVVMTKAPVVDGVIGPGESTWQLCHVCERKDREKFDRANNRRLAGEKWKRRMARKLKRAAGKNGDHA